MESICTRDRWRGLHIKTNISNQVPRLKKNLFDLRLLTIWHLRKQLHARVADTIRANYVWKILHMSSTTTKEAITCKSTGHHQSQLCVEDFAHVFYNNFTPSSARLIQNYSRNGDFFTVNVGPLFSLVVRLVLARWRSGGTSLGLCLFLGPGLIGLITTAELPPSTPFLLPLRTMSPVELPWLPSWLRPRHSVSHWASRSCWGLPEVNHLALGNPMGYWGHSLTGLWPKRAWRGPELEWKTWAICLEVQPHPSRWGGWVCM